MLPVHPTETITANQTTKNNRIHRTIKILANNKNNNNNLLFSGKLYSWQYIGLAYILS